MGFRKDIGEIFTVLSVIYILNVDAFVIDNIVNRFPCVVNCSCYLSEDHKTLEVTCNDNVKTVPDTLQSDTVEILDLSNNHFVTVRNNSFSMFTRLSTLILSNNAIEVIESEAFIGLHMLRNIHLSYNNLKSISPNIFSSNSVLETVSLNGNPFVYVLQDSPFLESNSIRCLDLSSCFLTSIFPATFSKLPRLHNLDISSNHLQSMPLDAVQYLMELRVVEVGNNRWVCSCSLLELMNWISSRRFHQHAHKPIKCFEKGQYKTWWTAANKDRSCLHREEATTTVTPSQRKSFRVLLLESSEFESSEDALENLYERKQVSPGTTSDMEIRNFARTLGQDFQTKISAEDSPDKRVVSKEVIPSSYEVQSGDNSSLLGSTHIVLSLIVISCTLSVSVFLTFMAINYLKKVMDSKSNYMREKLSAHNSNQPRLLTQSRPSSVYIEEPTTYHEHDYYESNHIYERIN
ncbi:SLIT and NTRK-like protein 4 [Periplaneta americana]|uniref:SLIT and NTRK-like protein 4 n=1 Tax=Periplaneta americana TaxID=6978 RepID=UPI0037E7C2CB